MEGLLWVELWDLTLSPQATGIPWNCLQEGGLHMALI